MNDVLLSHKSNDWATPLALYTYIINKGYYDPCPLYGEQFMDGLSLDWCNKKYFVNPPYSNISKWTDKAIKEYKDNLIYLLIPSRTDTKYFKKLYDFGCDFIFITGRLHFNDAKSGAPFPSMLVKLTGKGSRMFLCDQFQIINYFE